MGAQILNPQKEQGWRTKVIYTLSKGLKIAFPDMKGFSPQNLKYMKRFAEEYAEDEIGQQAIDQLPRGHISITHAKRELTPLQ